jgi:hypothetical protein
VQANIRNGTPDNDSIDSLLDDLFDEILGENLFGVRKVQKLLSILNQNGSFGFS